MLRRRTLPRIPALALGLLLLPAAAGPPGVDHGGMIDPDGLQSEDHCSAPGPGQPSVDHGGMIDPDGRA